MHEFNVLALIKGQDKYIFVYDDASQPQMINVFRDQAADPNLTLTWFDAVVLTKKANEQSAHKDVPAPIHHDMPSRY